MIGKISKQSETYCGGRFKFPRCEFFSSSIDYKSRHQIFFFFQILRTGNNVVPVFLLLPPHLRMFPTFPLENGFSMLYQYMFIWMLCKLFQQQTNSLVKYHSCVEGKKLFFIFFCNFISPSLAIHWFSLFQIIVQFGCLKSPKYSESLFFLVCAKGKLIKRNKKKKNILTTEYQKQKKNSRKKIADKVVW